MATSCTVPFRERPSIGTVAITLALLVGLPLLGVLTSGLRLQPFLEFPPTPRPAYPAPFSWPVFWSMALFVLLVVGPLLLHVLRSQTNIRTHPNSGRHFPWWGWVGLAWLAIAWLLAWTRFDWMAPLQRHTFAPVWLGYVVVVNALAWRRGGRSLMVERPATLAVLFAVSALFWWYFEFLNRFVQNWGYAGIGRFGTLEYLVFGTVSFSTVLPAVIGTRDLFATFPRLSAGLDRFAPLRLPRPCTVASVVLVLAAIALGNLARYPHWLFPLLWVAPLLVLSSVQALRGEAHVFAPLTRGDWRGIWLAALAGLACGLFWEMWNYYSLAHWEYNVSFVQRFHLFQMPLLGYAGYLPFGIECLAIAALLGADNNKESDRST
jgi:hypothetical protein